jgi:hypothetical protein
MGGHGCDEAEEVFWLTWACVSAATVTFVVVSAITIRFELAGWYNRFFGCSWKCVRPVNPSAVEQLRKAKKRRQCRRHQVEAYTEAVEEKNYARACQKLRGLLAGLPFEAHDVREHLTKCLAAAETWPAPGDAPPAQVEIGPVLFSYSGATVDPALLISAGYLVPALLLRE